MTTYSCAKAITATGMITRPLIDVVDGVITAIEPHGTPRADTVELGPVTLIPGFVDIHVHGGGSFSFCDGPDAARAAADFHRAHGTTSIIASLASATLDELAAQTVELRPLVDSGVLAGLHLEGPFLSDRRRGAHNPALLRNPDIAWLDTVMGNGVRMVTLAPELDGGLDAVRAITEAGVVAALGHSDATFEQTVAAIDAGIRVGTHLFNGMRPTHHREPGAVLALMRDRRVTVELISDGIHVHAALIEGVIHAAGPHRVALITDAISATGMPDGIHELAGSVVRVANGVAELVDGSSLAGSTLTMDAALRNTVACGVELEEAVLSACTTPARTLGLTDRGEIAVGKRADFVALDPDLTVTSVIHAGELVPTPTTAEAAS